MSNLFYEILAIVKPICFNEAMTTDDIIKHYGGMREAMTELAPYGIYRQMFYAWEKNGVPQGRQYQLHVLTDGKLKVEGKA